MDKASIELSVVIPVYNSRDCLPVLLQQLTHELEELGGSHEIVLVDDASPDNTWQVICELAPRYPRVSAIQLMANNGQATATLCGLAETSGRVVATMDDDLQHQPKELIRLLRALDERPDVDCVFGVYRTKCHSVYRNLGSRMIRRINAHAFSLPSGADYSSFRAMRRPVVEAILRHRTRNPAISPLVFTCTSRVASIPVEHAKRHSGHSHYTLGKQLRLALDNVCNVSMLPLRAVTFLGFAACLFSVILILAVIFRYVRGEIGIAGWTTVVILQSFSAGAILISLGIIGEYLVRILREVRGAPRFAIRDRIRVDGGQ